MPIRLTLLIVMLLATAAILAGQTTSFSYQGSLIQSGTPANGSFQMSFGLWTAQSGGAQVGSTIGPMSVSVTNGTFAALMDFGAAAFPGADRYLEVTVGGTTLTPRSKLNSTPYAIRALTVTGPVTGTNPAATLTVTNAQPGILTPSPANLPPAALKGEATSASDSNIGVLGIGDGSAGIGVLGVTNGNGVTAGQANAVGVLGLSTSPTGDVRGVSAVISSPDGKAFEANMPSGGSGYVFSSSKFNVRSNGDVTSDGNINAGGAVNAGFLSVNGGPGNLNINNGVIGATSIGLTGNMTAASIVASGSLNAASIATSGALSGNNVSAGSLTVVGGVTAGGQGTFTSVNTGLPSGGNANVCFDSMGANILRTCSSSLRYKKNVQPFTSGLKIVNRLHPITFTWKENGLKDVGLGAEDVAKVDPRLIFHNQKGEIEGVRYDQLNAVLINAIKQQQQQIDRLQIQVNTLMKRAHGSRRKGGTRKSAQK